MFVNMGVDFKQIPQEVIIEGEFQDLDSELRSDIRQLQNAYTNLRGMQDYQCPVVVSELNTQEIDRLTAERIERVSRDGNLLPSEQEEKIKKYKNLHRAVVTQINLISKILSKWQDVKFSYSELVQNIVPVEDLQNIVEQRCLRQVPQLCKQHARLIVNVFQAIAKLREFEKSEGVSKLRLEILNNLSSQRLAEVWADGSIMQVPVDVTDELSRATMYRRQAAEEMYF